MRMKRFLAGFLCLCMVGTMDMPYVQAASVAAKSEPVAQESAKQDAEDAKLSEDVENQDNDQRSEAAKQKGDGKCNRVGTGTHTCGHCSYR